jgi:hypothetical protein
MKFSTYLSLSTILASALAFPAYGNVKARQTWQPKPWTAPGPNDGEKSSPKQVIDRSTGYDTEPESTSTRTMPGP